MNLNKFHGMYFRGTAPPLSLETHLNLLLRLLRPLWYLPATVITHLQTFGPRLLGACSSSSWAYPLLFALDYKMSSDERRKKEEKVSNLFNEFNIHKVWKILLGKLLAGLPQPPRLPYIIISSMLIPNVLILIMRLLINFGFIPSMSASCRRIWFRDYVY